MPTLSTGGVALDGRPVPASFPREGEIPELSKINNVWCQESIVLHFDYLSVFGADSKFYCVFFLSFL